MENRFLCKAKRIENKKRTEWVQGYYAVICSKTVIIKNQRKEHDLNDDNWIASENEIVAVDAATACRCTGLRDKNNTLVWEHDIIFLAKLEDFFFVRWDDRTASFYLQGTFRVVSFQKYQEEEIEVIGNIFDNPALQQETTEKIK